VVQSKPTVVRQLPLLLDGRAPARDIEAALVPRIEAFSRASGRPPTLAVLLVGGDPLAERHAQLKVNAGARLGIRTEIVALDGNSSTADVLVRIVRLNRDPRVDGVFLQHPVPPQVDERACFDTVAVSKDVGGDGTLSLGRLALGDPGFVATTAAGILRLLSAYGVEVASRSALVIGRSPMVGKPVALLLLQAHATVTVCHSRSGGLPALVGKSELVVAAVGKPHFVKADWIAEGAVVIDAGYHPGGMGDVDPRATERASALTPVPGGVGPMTRAMLLGNVVAAAESAG
jgi:methylenetetrahydrofolate dehydrogenase (NADP+)/methenyltetrahydrofolate cyclohydrolase